MLSMPFHTILSVTDEYRISPSSERRSRHTWHQYLDFQRVNEARHTASSLSLTFKIKKSSELDNKQSSPKRLVHIFCQQWILNWLLSSLCEPAELALFFRIFHASKGKREAKKEWQTPSRVSDAPCSLCVCLCSPKKREKITSVQQGKSWSS